MKIKLDELDNLELELKVPQAASEDLRSELSRVQNILYKNIMSGMDLSYWFKREQILEDGIDGIFRRK